MDLGSDVWKMIKDAAEKHSQDIGQAVETIDKQLSKRPDYDSLVRQIYLDGLRDLVHDARHQSNRQLKRDTGFYGQPAKVVESDSMNIRAASEAIYDLYIAGRTLGTLLGKELPGVALLERETGNGHLANAALCERLAKIVPQEKTVREAVSSKKCMAIWRKCRESFDGEAGAWLKSKRGMPTANGHGTTRRRRKAAVA